MFYYAQSTIYSYMINGLTLCLEVLQAYKDNFVFVAKATSKKKEIIFLLIEYV